MLAPLPPFPAEPEPKLQDIILAKLDRIIELLDQMVQREEKSVNAPVCPVCGGDELEKFQTEDGKDKELCLSCGARVLVLTSDG